MKRKMLSVFCAAVLMMSLLAGCGASTGAANAPGAGGDAFDMMTESVNTSGALKGYDSVTADREYSYTEAPALKEDGVYIAEQKLIHTAGLTMETTAFDEAVAALEKLVSESGGYFSNSNVRNYSSGYRSADYVVRVPAGNFDAFLEQAGDLCHLLRRSTNTEDVSEVYYDTSGRLKTQQTKLARLQDLLARAESMEDIITIESAISETEQQIEYLSGTLSHYDALVDYATVNIELNEVYRLSNTEEPAQGFGSRFLTALKSGWKNFVSDGESLLISLAYSWMWLVIWGVVIVLAVRFVIRRRAARGKCGIFRKKKTEGNTEEKQEP